MVYIECMMKEAGGGEDTYWGPRYACLSADLSSSLSSSLALSILPSGLTGAGAVAAQAAQLSSLSQLGSMALLRSLQRL